MYVMLIGSPASCGLWVLHTENTVVAVTEARAWTAAITAAVVLLGATVVAPWLL